LSREKSKKNKKIIFPKTLDKSLSVWYTIITGERGLMLAAEAEGVQTPEETPSKTPLKNLKKL
jgi:hypothetical protein